MKAKNITELSHQLFYNQPVTIAQKEYYVPIYQELIDILKDDIINEPSQKKTFYIAGQSGTGKTTAMNFLPDDEIKKNFAPLYIDYRDLLNFGDADIIDVLLMLGFKLSEEHKNIKKKFDDTLKKIYETHHGKLEQTTNTAKARKSEAGLEVEAGIGTKFFKLLSLGGKLFTSFKMDKEVRKVTREFFYFKKVELLELTNDIISKWYEVNGDEKKLLIFFDDFDKLRVPKQINSIFLENRTYFENIECLKVVSIPMHLTANHEFNTASTYLKTFYLKLKNNPTHSNHPSSDKNEIEANKKAFVEIIKSRYEGDLIDENVFDKAIEISGGIIRQYVQLLEAAAKKVRRLKGIKISLNDLDDAISEKRKQLSMTIIGEELIKMLLYIHKNNEPYKVDSILFTKAVLYLQVIAHPNFDTWYDVNPLIKDTVLNYSKKKFEL